LCYSTFHSQYYHQLKSAEPEILFPAFCGDAEGTLRNEGRVRLALLNDLYFCEVELNRNKNAIKEGKLKRKLSSSACPLFCSQTTF